MSFQTTKAKLVTIITELTGVGERLQAVFGYFDPTPKQFPCAMIRMFGGSREEKLDTDNDLLTMGFVIRVLFRSDSDAANETLKENVIDDILEKLRESANVDTLDGTVEKFEVLEVVPTEHGEGDPLTGFDVMVACAKIKAIG